MGRPCYASHMCGRYASYLPPEALRRIFRSVNPLPNFEQSWNVGFTSPTCQK